MIKGKFGEKGEKYNIRTSRNFGLKTET